MKGWSLQNSAENKENKKKAVRSSLRHFITYVIVTLVIIFSPLVLTGCDLMEDAAEFAGELKGKLRFRDDEDRDDDDLIDLVSDEKDYVITITDDEAEWNSFDNAAKLSPSGMTSLRLDELSDVTSGYYYMMVSDEEKEVYDEIYTLLTGFENDSVLSTTDTDMIDHAFTCVLVDHPEIFYVKGYSIKTYTRDGVVERIAMSGTYTMTQSQVMEFLPELDRYYYACTAAIPADGDEYTKVKNVYEYIIRNTEYDLRAPNNQNILSVFVNQRSVCQGYAKAMQYILNRLGIFCTLVEGTVKENEAHVWDMVRINGRYYHVDTTWGDASYKLVGESNDGNALRPPEINYDYLCITTDEILETHDIKEIVPLVKCDSIDDNYYVREGLYFTSVDDEGLRRAFEKAYEQNLPTITLKCADYDVYHDMEEYLLEEQKIFNYLENTSVNFVTVEEQREIIFYL